MKPVYSTLHNIVDSNNQIIGDIIGFVSGTEGNKTLKYASLLRDGSSIATDITDTTLSLIDTNCNYSWSKKRESGTIISERKLPFQAALNSKFTYQVIVDVDEAKIPASYIVREIMPDWEINKIQANGADLGEDITLVIRHNQPEEGLMTVSINFRGSEVVDHIITYELTAGGINNCTYNFTGEVSYTLDDILYNFETTGNNLLLVSEPYLPVDKYDDLGHLNPEGSKSFSSLSNQKSTPFSFTSSSIGVRIARSTIILPQFLQ